jgi:chromosome transmission fidelity protein 1
MLNPLISFVKIIERARSVILAGGTMHPQAYYIKQLLPNISLDRVSTFSCGHVVPDENVLPLVVSQVWNYLFHF